MLFRFLKPPALPTSTLLAGVAVSLSLIAPALAQDQLVETLTPAPRPYPFEILGLQPGDSLEDVQAVFAGRGAATPSNREEVFRIQSPEGQIFEFTYETWVRVSEGQFGNRRSSDPYDSVTARLATDVMGGRPIAITRGIRKPSAELPDPLELQAQLEELYGPPSRVTTTRVDTTILYAWDTEGFIADMDARPPLHFSEVKPGAGINSTVEVSENYELCGPAQHYSTGVDYNFQYPRERDIMPGCIATFTVIYTGRPGLTEITFRLEDFDLARQNRDETDRQIVDALTNTEVEASDMDL